MKKIILLLSSTFALFLIILGAGFLVQSVFQKDASASGTVSYSETWTATAGVYAGTYVDYYGQSFPVHMTGLPGNQTGCAYKERASSYGYALGIDCSSTVTQWSVSGTINSGSPGVKRYFITDSYAFYNYDHPSYGNLQNLSASFCNGDSANPGGYFHPYLDGAYSMFAVNGTTVQGLYGTGIAGQDNYIQNSGSVWLSRAGQSGYLEAGKVLGGTTYSGTITTPTVSRKILCIED
jgi:uncharacterized protein (UPF0333 family)